jgi:aldehyde dehydrogenase (NAD+)
VNATLIIGGESQPAAGGDSFPVRAPVDDAPVGVAALGGAGDIDRAVAAARAAQPGWWAAPPARRERVLLDLARALEQPDARALVDLVIDESGSTIGKARAELAYSVELLRAAAGEARRLYGDTVPHDRPGRLSIVVREPVGAVGVISPFNAPLALLVKMVAFPLAAGNAVVIKPSEETPLTAHRLVELAGAVGMPPGVCNLVTGRGDCGAALARHPGVDGLVFTGSTEVGRSVARAAADRTRRVQLELGGKNPIVVFDDVDPERAAEVVCAGAFAHAGQICMANSRLVVTRGIADRLTDAIVRRCEALPLGDLRDPATAYGPLIHDRALGKVERHVGDAVAGGGELVTGGERFGRRGYRPTVVREPARDSQLWRDETFGPVLAIAVVDGEAEAIAAANDTDYGLSAAVLTRDGARALRVARAIRAGSVHVGMHAFQSTAMAPIGGFAGSGVGRSGGRYSTDEVTECKWISVELEEAP